MIACILFSPWTILSFLVNCPDWIQKPQNQHLEKWNYIFASHHARSPCTSDMNDVVWCFGFKINLGLGATESKKLSLVLFLFIIFFAVLNYFGLFLDYFWVFWTFLNCFELFLTVLIILYLNFLNYFGLAPCLSVTETTETKNWAQLFFNVLWLFKVKSNHIVKGSFSYKSAR